MDPYTVMHIDKQLQHCRQSVTSSSSLLFYFGSTCLKASITQFDKSLGNVIAGSSCPVIGKAKQARRLL